MSEAVTPRPAGHTAGLVRGIYLPRSADALACAMSTYGIPLLVLATTRSAAPTGAAFDLEWIPAGGVRVGRTGRRPPRDGRRLPPRLLGHVITACAALQALGLRCAFTRLRRTDPALRT